MEKIVTKFFRRYDQLMKEQGPDSAFWRKVDHEKTSGYFCKAKRERRMPPPTQLKKLEGYLDNQFLLECMQFYSDYYPECMTIKMDRALDEFVLKYRHKGRRKEREMKSQLYLERAWKLGI